MAASPSLQVVGGINPERLRQKVQRFFDSSNTADFNSCRPMTMQRSLISRRLLSSIVKPELIRAQQITAHSNALKINRTSIRHASNDTPSSQPIVLEKPDKFRPPSHSQRLARPRQKAYNQESTPHEQEAQKTRRYPHMFPNEGTFMHWFLTNRFIHVWITMVRTTRSSQPITPNDN